MADGEHDRRDDAVSALADAWRAGSESLLLLIFVFMHSIYSVSTLVETDSSKRATGKLDCERSIIDASRCKVALGGRNGGNGDVRSTKMLN
jgi:hypothetical protein